MSGRRINMQCGTKSRKQRGFLCGSGFPHVKKSQLAASMMVLWAILTFSDEASSPTRLY